MLLSLIAACCVVAVIAEDQPCFHYERQKGEHTKSLGATANGCRQTFKMDQPDEAHCVLSQYGSVNKETWELHCDKFLNFINDYIYDLSRKEKMVKNAYTDCGCENAVSTEERKKFISCWKGGLDKTCPEDIELVGGVITKTK